jgi:hypothetical protein
VTDRGFSIKKQVAAELALVSAVYVIGAIFESIIKPHYFIRTIFFSVVKPPADIR